MQNSQSSNQKSGKALLGLILLAIGFLLLLRTLDIFFIPSWVVSWPVFLIILGLFIGSRQGYNQPSAFIPIVIGLIFLSNKALPDMDLSRFFWPFLIIAFGVWMIAGRKKPGWPGNTGDCWDKKVKDGPEQFQGPDSLHADTEKQSQAYSGSFPEDRIESVSIFGGIKKNVVSKNFQGGEIVNFFGGSEINLMQADIHGRITLEVVQIFGGTKIIVPANWTVHSEMVAVFGGVEDKRPPQLNAIPDKVIVIQGTSVFGGIDIRSF